MLKTSGTKFRGTVLSELKRGGIAEVAEVEVVIYSSKRTGAYSGWGVVVIQKVDGRILSSTEYAQTCDPESWKAKLVIRKLVRRANKVVCL